MIYLGAHADIETLCKADTSRFCVSCVKHRAKLKGTAPARPCARGVPFMAQASLSTGSPSHLLLNITVHGPGQPLGGFPVSPSPEHNRSSCDTACKIDTSRSCPSMRQTSCKTERHRSCASLRPRCTVHPEHKNKYPCCKQGITINASIQTASGECFNAQRYQ